MVATNSRCVIRFIQPCNPVTAKKAPAGDAS